MLTKGDQIRMTQAIPDFVKAQIRTYVPYVVAFLVQLGFDIDTQLATAFFVMIGGSAYYFAVRLVAKWFPWAEVLLGVPAAPKYESVGAGRQRTV